MAYQVKVKYFNSFVLRKIVEATAANQTGSWPGLPWEPTVITDDGTVVNYPKFPWDDAYGTDPGAVEKTCWYLEESRIKGGFNNSIVGLGVRAYSVNEKPGQEDRSSSLIFSGAYNDRTGYNETNVFSISENIIRDANAKHGSIQKLFAGNTNLMVFQENKVHNALINKSTVYSGTQGAEELTGDVRVIGQFVPYLGEYGISKNPESLASYGNRKYFVDKNRSVILRLSRDGITEISMYGMRKYFRDQLAVISDDLQRRVVSKTQTIAPGPAFSTITLPDVVDIEVGSQIEIQYSTAGDTMITSVVTGIPSSTTVTISPSYTIDPTLGTADGVNFITYTRDKTYGGWDAHNKNYTLSLQTSSRLISTDEDSFDTLSFDENIKGWTSFYSYKPIFIGSLKNNFYTFIDNKIYKHYVSIANNYCKFYGSATPDEANIQLVFNPAPSVKKNFNTVAYEGDNGWEVEFINSSKQGFDNGIQYNDTSSAIRSYDEGAYVENGVTLRAGFDRKENRYVADIVNSSSVRPGEIIFGKSLSGIKGYFTTIKLKVDATTDVGGPKELYSVSTNYVMSSY